VLYNALNEFGIPMKLERIVKMCLNETYSKVHTGKNLYDAFPIQNGLKHGDTFQLCFRICHEEGPRKPEGTELTEHIALGLS
jgi:hypothetical protein